jgi:Ca-activated chloride channel homolog
MTGIYKYYRMKKTILLMLLSVLFGKALHANGVVLNKAETGSYLTLLESSVNAVIESQVSNTVATQVYRNDIGDTLRIKFAFPLPENASATKLRYKINGVWYIANFAPIPQDTTTGGSPGEVDYTLQQYLGLNPLFFDINQNILKDSTITVELTYVELLKYKLGTVKYLYPNNYQLIQNPALTKQEIHVTLNSERTIENIELLSHTATSISNNGNQAFLHYVDYESEADADYYLSYSLSLDELGMYSLSTYFPDSVQQDQYGRGFCTLIIEPDPSENTDVIQKVFTLIIDNSGSMSGDKILQARDAATFIVQNLNDGDKFNIVSFSDNVRSYRPEHVDYNMTNEASAISYISALVADGSTNISGAFDVAVPQFSGTTGSTANIIIFFTDGEQTSGILDTDALIEHIDNLIVQSETDISLFTFGIGDYTNERLLTTIANNNSGTAEFLANNELEEVITDFYLMIRNPVLMNTAISFSPSLIGEIYPVKLPNLYKGQQMILVGRYSESAMVTTRLIGTAFSDPVEYEYSIPLSDTFNTEIQFLSKLWAQGKIVYLMEQYYLNLNEPEVADSIKNEVIKLSMDYGVISPFTSFQGGEIDTGYPTGIGYEFSKNDRNTPEAMSNEYLQIIAVSPNPCSDVLNINITTRENVDGILTLKLVNANGQPVYLGEEYVISLSDYLFNIDILRLHLKKGVYLLLIEYQNRTLVCKVVIE